MNMTDSNCVLAKMISYPVCIFCLGDKKSHKGSVDFFRESEEIFFTMT